MSGSGRPGVAPSTRRDLRAGPALPADGRFNSPPRGRGRRGGALPAGLSGCLGAILTAVLTAAAGQGDELRFVRVNLPAAAVREVPREAGRFVPMPVREFEDAVARLGPGQDLLPRPLAAAARYSLACEGLGICAGSVEFTIEPAAGLPGWLPLGRVAIGRCKFEAGSGTGEAVVFGLPDGRVAVRTAGPGTYTASIQLPVEAGGRQLRLPLVPALVTTVELSLPEPLRPFVVGPGAATAIVGAVGEGRWEITVGAGGDLFLAFDERAASPPVLVAWNAVTVRARQAEVAVQLVPAAAWNGGRLAAVCDPGLEITGVGAAGVEEIPWQLADGLLRIDVPLSIVGSRLGVLVEGVAPLPAEGKHAVPVIRPAPEHWGGCGVRLEVDPALAVEGLELEQCLVVPQGAAAGWLLPESAAAGLLPVDGPQSARFYLEHQAPGGSARLLVGARRAIFDTARVTTVEISPAAVLGRANCDVRIRSGEAFEIVADVAPDWIIDAVEPVDWSRPPAGDGVTGETGLLDWRVARSARGSELRIDLPVAANSRRSLGLRISGHRAGLRLGSPFATAAMDMVRLPGETEDSALLEFRVGPTAVVEVAGGAMGLEPAADRLKVLAGDAPPRARIRAGERAGSVMARLVQRRPPVEADIRVALAARDDRLAESFTFTCRPVAGELDALLIHFSEPVGEGLEWSLVDPIGGTLAARLLATGGPSGSPAEAAGLGLPSGDAATAAASGIAETWLVELRPATTSAVILRAARSLPFGEVLRIPLAWVEAAERPGGVVAVRGGRGRRPEVINRRLRELPPAADGEEAALVELAYGPPETLRTGDRLAAADLLPPAPVGGARAWAWREATRCWCHDSGRLEWETRIDLENQGREELTITVPPGLALEGISVAGAAVAGEPAAAGDGSTMTVPLASRRGRVNLVIRGSGSRDAGLGWWPIGAVSCGVDVPVLGRDVQLLLPPGLTIAAAAPGAARSLGWAARLFAAPSGAASDSEASDPGFRGVPITAATRGGFTDVVVVRRSLIFSVALVAAVLAGGFAFASAGRSGLAVACGCLVAAAAALWCPPPWHAIPRAMVWAGLLGIWMAGCRRVPRAARLAAVVLAVTLPAGSIARSQEPPPGLGAAAAADPSGPPGEPVPLRVFITPGVGGSALVPEQLFRRLVDFEGASALPPVRVLASEVVADPAAASWRIALEIDADRGGSLVLDQTACGGSWEADSERPPDGLTLTPGGTPAELRLLAATAGRRRVWLRCRPGIVREGDIEAAAICLPPAPRGRLRMAAAEPPIGSATPVQCDRADPDGPWQPAAGGADGFDVAGAARVRLVRPVNPRDRLPSELRAAVSFNDIDWQANACRVTASFEVGGEREIVRQVVVRADPDLEPIPPAGGILPQPLGGGRWLLARPQPRAGQVRFAIEFRRPLADPVGMFEVPAAWLEGVGNDVRTVRLRPVTGLDAVVELPRGLSLLQPRAEDGPATAAVWRGDAAAAGGEPGPADGPARPRITVTRRDQKPRGSQELAVEFAEDHVGLRLRCQLEAASLPLVEVPVALPPAAVIDRVTLRREAAASEEPAAAEISDVVWSRVAADRIIVMIQRPRTGRFRLELVGRLPNPPGARGRLPLARLGSPLDLPLAVSCRVPPPLAIVFEDGSGRPGEGGERFEIGAEEAGPAYTLARQFVPEPLPSDARPPASVDPVARAALEMTAVELAIDRRGRGWGLVRFELVSPQPLLTLRLPPGLRLFEIRVDGREVIAVSRGGDAWDVRLHDIDWPRTMVALIAGPVGQRLDSGEPIRLEPPQIDGLKPRRVTWSLDTPAGFEIRVSPPARVLDDAAWTELDEARRGWQEEAFLAAVLTLDPWNAERLRAFAAGRRRGDAPAGERAWYEAWRQSRGAEPVQTRLLAAADGGLTIRSVPTTGGGGGRGIATLVIVSLLLAGWQFATRLPEAWQRLLAFLHRWWWAGCGVVWLLVSEPALPGWLLVAAGLWFAAARWRRPLPADPPAVSPESTRTFLPA